MLRHAMILCCLILALLCLVVATDLPAAASAETDGGAQPIHRRD